MALLVSGESEEIPVSEALADRGRLTRELGRPLPLAARLVLEDPRQQQVAALDAVLAGPVEQATGAGEPAAGRPRVAATRQVDPDPEGAATGRDDLFALDPGPVGALQHLQVLGLAAGHVGGGGEQLQVLARKAFLLRGPREVLVGAGPGPLREALAAFAQSGAQALPSSSR